jgi:hypothetical protein
MMAVAAETAGLHRLDFNTHRQIELCLTVRRG